MKNKLNLALLISGSGSTAEAVIKAHKSGRLHEISSILVFSSNAKSLGIAKAKVLDVPVVVINRKDFKNKKEFDKILKNQLLKHKINLISQNGWMPLTPKDVIIKYQGRIFNQHPGPLDPNHPDFGGKEMYGKRVTCARLIYLYLTGEKNPWTESTTHLTNEIYDNGNLINIKKFTFTLNRKKLFKDELLTYSHQLINETIKIHAQLLPIEHENVIETIEKFIQNNVGSGYIRKQPLISDKNVPALFLAKQVAIQLFPKG